MCAVCMYVHTQWLGVLAATDTGGLEEGLGMFNGLFYLVRLVFRTLQLFLCGNKTLGCMLKRELTHTVNLEE